jgi:pSer/pThr/pTyr-binding forkhead associated (FHA) protein
MVAIIPLGITASSPQDISQKVELDDLLHQHRLDPRSPRYRAIIETRWQCTNTHCPENAHWQGQLLVLPKVTARGEPRCPTCRGQLLDLGKRERLHEIVVEQRSGSEIMRFPAEAGSPVVIGRGLSLKGVNLQVDSLSLSRGAIAAIERVSRRHLTLTVEEPVPGKRRMVVTDLQSSNGTTVEHPPGSGKPTVVKPGEPAYAMEKDRIVLGDGVMLRFSGKRYLTATGSRPAAVIAPAGGTGDFGGATVLH